MKIFDILVVVKPWVKIGLNYFANMLAVFVFFGLCIDHTLPDINSAQFMKRTIYIKIFDRNNELLANFGQLQEACIDAKTLPKHIIHAIIDTEDKDFFRHCGIDFLAIVRSFFKNILSNRIVAGGSSITQQLAKNILQNEEKVSVYDKSLMRKIKEFILAIKLERKYSKYEILSFYLNRVYFGAACYGLHSAAILYFNKKPADLNLYEAAAIVGLVQAPSRFAKHKNFWEMRTRHVLHRMYKNKHIEKEQLQLFKDLNCVTRKNLALYGHFADYVISQIPEHLKNRDLIIKSTLDSHTQQKAQIATQKAYDEVGKDWDADQGAMIVIDKNGAIRAVIGSLDYQKSQFNIAINGKRSTGSFFKFFIYLSAMQREVNPESLISDSQLTIGAWTPSNYLHHSVGKIPVKDAFAQSVNSSAIALLICCGIKNVIKLVHKLGVQEKIMPNPSIALGGFNTSLLNNASALLPIINGGYMIQPYCITEIRDANTNEILYKHHMQYEKVLDSRTVWHMWQLLKYTVTNGTGRAANIRNKIVGAKTGTSNDYRDVLFVGATPEYTFASWFGRNDFKPMKHAGGSPSSLACKHFLESMPNCIADVEFDMNFDFNTKTVEDLMYE